MSRKFNFERSDLQRINLVGTSASGKSTLGRQLAEVLEVRFIEMDALFWEPNWTQVETGVFCERVADAIASPTWVLDGNYHGKTHALKWSRATMVVWLDMPFSTNMIRVVSRALNRAWTQEELWPGTGNRESFRRSLFSADSIILWAASTYRRRRETYSVFENNPPEGLRFLRLSNPNEVAEFLVHVERLMAAESTPETT